MPNLDFHGRTEPVRLAFQGQNVTQLQLCLNEDPELVNYRRDDNCGTAWLKAMAGGKASTAFLQTLLDYKADTTQIEKTVLYSKQVGQAIASDRMGEIEFRYIKNWGVKA